MQRKSYFFISHTFKKDKTCPLVALTGQFFTFPHCAKNARAQVRGSPFFWVAAGRQMKNGLFPLSSPPVLSTHYKSPHMQQGREGRKLWSDGRQFLLPRSSLWGANLGACVILAREWAGAGRGPIDKEWVGGSRSFLGVTYCRKV